MVFARVYYSASPTQMFIRFGFPERGFFPPVVTIIDTHDGVKKKKKKKQRTFDEELERTAKLKRQIREVVYPVTPQVEEPKVEPKPEPEVAKPFVTEIAPAVDYAGLAKDEIVTKIKQEATLKARQHQEELKRIELQRIAEEDEEEEELAMILDAIL